MEETPTFVPNKRVAKADNVNPKGKNLRPWQMVPSDRKEEIECGL